MTDPTATPWLEYVRLLLAAITPLMTGAIAGILLYFGLRIDRRKQVSGELVKKRIDFYEKTTPHTNDLYCFCRGVGHWATLDPQKLILSKRELDRQFHLNRFLLTERTFGLYDQFITQYFSMFVAAGRPARLRVDLEFLKAQMGPKFQKTWLPFLGEGDVDAQCQAYEVLMESLGREIKGEN